MKRVINILENEISHLARMVKSYDNALRDHSKQSDRLRKNVEENSTAVAEYRAAIKTLRNGGQS